MNKRIFANNKLLAIAVLALFVFYSWMAFQIPYTHDDWDWGLEEGMRHLLAADINSRYTGNLIEVVMTRSPFLKTAIMGLVLAMVPLAVAVFAAKLVNAEEARRSDLQRAGIFAFANLLILLFPRDIWRQTNGWVAGFANFVVSGLALAVYYLILRKNEAPRPGTAKRALTGVGYFVFGVAMQLLLENVSVFVVLFSLFFVIVNRKRPGILRRLAPLLLGNLLGLAVMFSSNIYGSLLDTGSAVGGYRQLMYDTGRPLYAFFLDSALRYFGLFVPQIVSHNGVLMGCAAGLMALTAFSRAGKKKLALCLGGVDLAFCLYYACAALRGAPLSGIQFAVGEIAVKPLVTAVDCAFTALMAAEILAFFSAEKEKRFWLLVLWLSPFLIIAPMVLVNTIGPRNFYTTNICFVMFAIVILYDLLTRSPRLFTVAFSVFCALALTVLGVRWVRIYAPIGACARARDRIVEEAVAEGAGQILLPQYPNRAYLWHPDPSQGSTERVGYFKRFYHIPDDVELRFESWDQ